MISAATTKSMELEGNLSSFQLPEVLKFLHMGKMTGALSLEADGRMVVLLIKEGMLSGSLSADHEQKLRQLLIYGGHVNAKQIEELMESRRVGRRLPGLLIEKRMVEHEKLVRTITLQVKEELWEVFSWTAGTFKFENGALPEHDEDFLALPIEPLIEEGLKRMEQWRGIAKNLGHLDEVYRVNHELASLPANPLSPTTWRVLSLINGRLTVQALIALSGLGKFETLIALDSLIAMQMIEASGRQDRPAAARKQASAARREKSSTETSNDTEDKSGETANGGGLRGLFGRRKKNAVANVQEIAPAPSIKPANGATPKNYQTSIAFGCEVINQLAAAIADEFGENAVALIAEAWRGEMMRRPRADLVRIDQGLLTAKAFDRYAQVAGGINKSLAGCHDETLEALRGAGRTLAGHVREHTEDARQWMLTAIGPCLDQVNINSPLDFSARNWASAWIHD